MTRLAALVLAYLFVALAIIGVFLPGLPTVPFLLLAAWFSARGSKRLNRWLYAHPQFGSILRNWEQEGAISARTKIIAIVMICASWVILSIFMAGTWAFAGISVIFVAVSVFIATRPQPH